MKCISTILMFVLLSPNIVSAEQPIQDLKEKVKLTTDVMVLATVHLRATKESLNKDSLAPIVSKLKKYSPTAIAIEALRPADIISMIHGADEYNSVLSQFVGDTFLILANQEQKSLALTPNQAMRKMNVLVTSASIVNEQREEIIRLAVAAYDKNTALLHWQYLAGTFTTTKLSSALRFYLKELSSKNNEVNQIAISLAIKSGVNRLYPIDDHLDKDIYPEVIEDLMPFFKESTSISDLRKSEYVTKPMKLQKQAVKTGNWLALYSWINSEAYKAQVINDEWRLFVDEDFPVKSSLARLALWEVRNLNMVSNIMRVVAKNIGGKIVIVVGANHKVFFEDYLSRMIGVNLVQFNDIETSKLK